jgi:anthranilate phosphoribosyltransferase
MLQRSRPDLASTECQVLEALGEDRMNDVTPVWYASAMAELLARRELSASVMRRIVADLVAGQCPEVETAALLIAMRAKGETATELAEAAQVLREHMVQLETNSGDVLDTCGTGGDEAGTFNISTATAFVAAAAGVPVVKHGNRAVSSRSGSSEVLEALGATLQSDPATARFSLEQTGIAFCYAPAFHPTLRHVAAVRRRLRVRTLFNCLGPLANPARANYQLVGVGRPDLLDPMAGALARLGVRHAILVCGSDGLDEVTLGGKTWVREVAGGKVSAHEWAPNDFGLAPCTIAELSVADPAASAQLIRELFHGRDGPASRVVLANAAAALLAAERATTLAEGVRKAGEVIRNGQARQVLNHFIAASRSPMAGEQRAFP